MVPGLPEVKILVAAIILRTETPCPWEAKKLTQHLHRHKNLSFTLGAMLFLEYFIYFF